MNIKNFSKPEKHPYGMLRGYDRAYEKEAVLAIILRNACDKGDLYAPHVTVHSHPAMVEDGLLEEVEGGAYRLTKLSAGLLYSVYGV